MTLPLTITQSLDRIQAWARNHAPGVLFRPPANPAAIENFTQKSGVSVPQDLEQLLSIMDGETRGSAGMIGNWRLLPITEIQAAWGLLTKLAEKGAFTGMEPRTAPYLRKAWWSPGWIPIVSNDIGDYFCLDTDPPDPQRKGQILLFLGVQPERVLVAGSLRAWLDRIVRDLESGLYSFHPEEGFNGEAFMWSSLEGKHVFDNIPDDLIAQ